MRRLPTLSSLQAFEAAARLGSFQAAADELNRVPSAVSKQIKALEAELGVTLFVKDGRHRALTEQGSTYAHAVTQSFDKLAVAGNELLSHERPDELRVSTTPAIMSLLMIPNLSLFKQRYPLLNMALEIASQGNADNSDIDATINLCEGERTGQISERLWNSCWLPMTTPAFAREIEGVGEHIRFSELPIISHLSVPRLWNEWFELYEPDAGPVSPTYTVDTGSNAIQLLDSGTKGVILGLFPLLGEFVRSGRLVILSHQRVNARDIDYYLTYRRALRDSRKIRRLRHWLKEAVDDLTAKPIPFGEGKLEDYAILEPPFEPLHRIA